MSREYAGTAKLTLLSKGKKDRWGLPYRALISMETAERLWATIKSASEAS